MPADLIEEAQEPRLAFDEIGRLLVSIPDLTGPSDELIAAGTFHAVNAQIRAADADGVFRRPGAGGVVLGRDQPMPRIDRRGRGGAEIYVAQAQHQIAGVE